MKISKLLLLPMLVISLTFSSCNTDEPDSSSTSSTTTTNKKVAKPKFDKFLSTSDMATFSIRVRFKTGGDREANLNATVHWKAYSKKPSSTPKKSELSIVESMRQYGAATYHNTGSKKGMTESIVFDKSHAGCRSSYIYYYVECSNSVGSSETSITYMVTK
ncbi:MAG: hypothetical protein NC241_01740 [Bacteroides sp.]|nr:hypothetical protein [Bacteroides sp.]MCM1457131.1 hypothetical protein [Lachnoclostridium sp.]